MGGPRVTPKTEMLLIQIFRSMTINDNKVPSAKQVLAMAEAHIKKEQRKDIFLPKVRKVQMILAQAIKKQNELPEEQKLMDESWSIKTLDEYPLPPDSLPYVLQAWRYSVNLGEDFSIRQAKWCSRLYALFKDNDISKLWFTARMYVYAEKSYQLFSHYDQYPPDYEIDSSLVMGHWERKTFDTTIFLLGLSEGGISLRPSFPCANDGEIAEEFIHALPQIEYLSPDQRNEVFDRLKKIDSLIKQLKSSLINFPDIESRMVYLRHLNYLSQMPKWDSLNPEDIRDIIVDLRKWIIDQIPRRHDIVLNTSFPREIYNRAGWVAKGAE